MNGSPRESLSATQLRRQRRDFVIWHSQDYKTMTTVREITRVMCGGWRGTYGRVGRRETIDFAVCNRADRLRLLDIPRRLRRGSPGYSP